ncbi:MAG: hypothetical protein GWO24_02425, partial [Akkermansiaceae bacterium]|nr:hypothetical protein [Akkermansiaceae bacterium]
VELPEEVTIDSYAFATANDAPERDPITWSFQGSGDGVNWTTLDVRNNHPTTTERSTLEGPFAFKSPLSHDQ